MLDARLDLEVTIGTWVVCFGVSWVPGWNLAYRWTEHDYRGNGVGYGFRFAWFYCAAGRLTGSLLPVE